MVDDELEGSTNDDADDWVSYEVKSDFDSMKNRRVFVRIPNIGPRPWVERSDPWPRSSSGKPALRPRPKKNKNNNNTISQRQENPTLGEAQKCVLWRLMVATGDNKAELWDPFQQLLISFHLIVAAEGTCQKENEVREQRNKTTTSGSLVAMDASNGKILWSTANPRKPMQECLLKRGHIT
ncbi:hypothetical protein PIB30_005076 [Stylosanthes scabra]|uniref:Uncharacterized protein n=1 Tax=Stylosanthes scabra TaxID=79078 RepID=A0ABU6Z0Q3_9FABA|nr:hypothetical protein [Stylosanthes scabra]